MITSPPTPRICLPYCYSDTRNEMSGLAMLMQQTPGDDRSNDAIYDFRGCGGGLIRVFCHDGVGLCFLNQRLLCGSSHGW
jgi:transposase